MVPTVGFEPTHPAKDFGFKDRCVYRSAMQALTLDKGTLSICKENLSMQNASTQSQLDKFKQAARELECDDDPKRFRERVGKLAVAKPKDEKPE
jgi:chaperonin cofactor prefoldin